LTKASTWRCRLKAVRALPVRPFRPGLFVANGPERVVAA